MDKRIPFFFLSVMGAGELVAQPPKAYQLSGGGTTKVFTFLMDDDLRITAGMNAFGSDSSRLEFSVNGADMAPVAAHAYSMNSYTTFLNDGIRADDGILVAGMRFYYSNNAHAYLAKADGSGNLAWMKTFAFSLNSQDQFVSLVPEGNSFSAFTCKGGSRMDEVDRVDGQMDGSGFTVTQISADANFQLLRSVPTAVSQRILSAGVGAPFFVTPSDLGILMMHGGAGPDWMRSYDLGGIYGLSLTGLAPLADGHFIACGYMPVAVGSFLGVVMKVDTDGEVIWCRTLTDVSGGAWIADVQEQADGDLLVCGNNGTYMGLLARLDAEGTPLWNRIFPSDRLFRFQREGGRSVVYGSFSRIELDENGMGCSFIDEENLTAASPVPVVTGINVANTPCPSSIETFAPPDRPNALSWSNTCTLTEVPEHGPRALLSAFPNPTSGGIQLQGGKALSGTPYRVHSMTGRQVASGSYTGSIDLGSLPAGVYTIELPAAMRRTRVVKQ